MLYFMKFVWYLQYILVNSFASCLNEGGLSLTVDTVDASDILNRSFARYKFVTYLNTLVIHVYWLVYKTSLLVPCFCDICSLHWLRVHEQLSSIIWQSIKTDWLCHQMLSWVNWRCVVWRIVYRVIRESSHWYEVGRCICLCSNWVTAR